MSGDTNKLGTKTGNEAGIEPLRDQIVTAGRTDVAVTEVKRSLGDLLKPPGTISSSDVYERMHEFCQAIRDNIEARGLPSNFTIQTANGPVMAAHLIAAQHLSEFARSLREEGQSDIKWGDINTMIDNLVGEHDNRREEGYISIAHETLGFPTAQVIITDLLNERRMPKELIPKTIQAIYGLAKARIEMRSSDEPLNAVEELEILQQAIATLDHNESNVA